MRFNLQYGAGSLPLEITNRMKVETIQPKGIVDFSHMDAIINHLENPVNSESITRLATKAESSAIVMNGENDTKITTILLDILLGLLRVKFSDPENIVIIYPTNSNTSKNESEVSKILGNPTDDGHLLILHDSKLTEDMCFVGETPSYATPVSVNNAFAEADLKIGIGTIQSNLFVGATGGRMSVLPWVSSHKTIERNTKLQATHPIGPFVIDSATCIDLEEASKIAGLDFILNAVPDSNENIAQIAAGNPYSAWKKSIGTVRSLAETEIQYKADVTVVSTGSLHSDRTLFDAVDSLYSACEATEQGGVIILVAECLDGAGPSGFVRGISECKSESDVAVLSETNFEMGMEKARFFWKVLSSRKIILCSRLRESIVSERLHCLAVRDPQEGLELARSLIVSRPKITIIPQGMRTIPFLKN